VVDQENTILIYAESASIQRQINLSCAKGDVAMRTNSQKFITTPLIVILMLITAMAANGDEFCKWTDEDGVVHYDENCPGDVPAAVVETQGHRTESQKIAAEEVSDSLLSAPTQPNKSTKKAQSKKAETHAGVTADSGQQKSRNLDEMSADQLDVLCQQEREKRLAPERNELIKNCVDSERKSQKDCERYFADYGDAQRNYGGHMQPALHSDLPECVAAWEARRK
jgi:hypothetical protein